ncbi:MAG: cellulose binding domain-containing protein [bacterium]
MCGDGARPTSAELVLPGDEAGDPVDPDAFSVLVTYAEWGRWGPASCGDVSLTNSGDLPVDGWATTFTTPPGTQVGGFWVADIVELERGSYRAVDQGWNAWLAPQAGNSQIYGVCMDGSGVPTDFAFEAP